MIPAIHTTPRAIHFVPCPTTVIVTWDTIAALPEWLLLGIVLGAVLTVLVAVVFYAGERLFEDPQAGSKERVAGADRRTTEVAQYLGAINEQYVENYTIGDHEVEFYLPDRGVAITYDAHTFFGLGDADVHAILCEYEMPAGQLGTRLPFETPTIENEQPSTPSQSAEATAAFRTLGLSPTADPDRVRAAYRQQIKQAHPDHGGDKTEFQQLQEAYATAQEYAEQASSATHP